MTTHKRFDWKIFLVLWLAGVWAVIALIPYSLALQGAATAGRALPIPLPVLLAISVAQNAVLLAIAIAAGLFFAYRSGLGLPILEGLFAHENVTGRTKAILLPSIVLGVLGSLAIIALDAFVFAPLLRGQPGGLALNVNAAALNPAAWRGFLASFYGGIDEEIFLRLFVMSLFVFLGKFVSHTAAGRPTLAVLWIANLLAAVLFGLGHLPATAALVPITPLIVVRAIVLNGVVGVACGYLYFTRGLEAAMLSHFSADIVLHVLFAL